MSIAERVADHLHPAIAALKADPAGAAAFWERVAVEKAPLIEADPERPGFSLVTYVFPLPEGAKYVVVSPGFGEAKDNVLDLIPGTNVCHAAYRYRNDVRATYGFMADMPLIDIWRATDAELKAFMDVMLTAVPSPDPHHRESFTSRAGEGQPDNVASILSLPDAPAQPYVARRADVPHGKVDRTDAFASQILGNARRIWVYTPPGYDADAAPYPLLVAFDGGGSLTLTPIHRIIENLIAEGRIRPMVAVFVDNPTATSRNDELPCSEPFAGFLETELIPWVRERYNVSADPADGYVTGVSYGGLAAMWMGYRLPHVFGNVIAQAPSLWWGPGFDMTRALGSQTYKEGWLVDQYEAAPKLPLRIWQEIGLMEHPERMIEPNRRMKAVLEAKGYDLTYSEPAGGHDYALWRGTIAEALETLAAPIAG
ncbi:MAG TPA: alpha/beta hydrolase-fold protein [Caulobacteraceae bacterium]|nr:alpha/beta hydrolase-fold protein [Caulobacteraceae bacterium]